MLQPLTRLGLLLILALGLSMTARAQVPLIPGGSQQKQKQQPGNQGIQQPKANPQGSTALDILRQFVPPNGPQQNGLQQNGPGNSRNNPPFRRDFRSGDPNRFGPGPLNGPGAPPQRSIISAAQVSYLPLDALQRLLRQAVFSLDDDLSGMSTGGGWKKHLQLAALVAAISSEQTAPPDAELRDRLNFIADLFDEVSQKPEYGLISRLWGFRTVHVVLREYALPPDVRIGRQLAAAAQVLTAALNDVGTGGSWIAHLRLAELSDILAAKEMDSAERAQRLQEIRQGFDDVSRKPQFAVVADLPGFRAIQAQLAQLINSSSAPAPAAPDEAPASPQPEPPAEEP